jgi:hypothetical protein
MMAEKFSAAELTALRTELFKGGLDSRQTAEVFQMFLMGHGYGASPESAIEAATRVGGAGCSLDAIRQELEHLALVM